MFGHLLIAPHSGACAVVGIFNPSDRSLRLALTGDECLLLVREQLADTYEMRHHSVDRNATTLGNLNSSIKVACWAVAYREPFWL